MSLLSANTKHAVTRDCFMQRSVRVLAIWAKVQMAGGEGRSS